MEDNNNENKKEIEIVTGDGHECEFSSVYDHLVSVKSKEEKKRNIIIPEVKKKK